MHIKQVIISGFRSYRDQVDIEEFSKHHNVVVGRNGSGKSNFFLAIQFVLSDEFSHLRSETKQGLLHEGTGPRVLNAFVEIVFDNTDQRLPVEKDEVRIRRLIGAKKDTYFIDNKACTRQDIVNMLESAGFSRSNPYYIVKQGKINELATAKDEHRLKLLREVAGTRVYDERKEESLGILADSESKRDKIDNLLKYIEERLKSLETEKEELKEYQKYDRQKRSLEYTIYDHESKEARRKLESLSDKRDEAHKRQEQLEKETLAIFEESKSLKKKQREMTRKFQNLDEERTRLSEELTRQYELKSETQLEVDDLRKCVDGEKNNRKLAHDKLDELNKEIDKEQQRLQNIQPKFEELTRNETNIKTESKIAEQRRKDLYTKCGQKEMFKTSQERDDWLKKEIRNCNRQIEDLTEQKQRLESEREGEKQRSDESANQMMRTKQELEMLKDEIDANRRKINEVKAERDRKQQGRTELWNREAAANQAVHNAADELKRAEAGLKSMMGRSIMNGVESVKRVLHMLAERGGSQQVIDGYHGLLIDNFKVNKRYFTAVEVTAGNRLFHHIVDTDRVATKILDEINRQKWPGEVNFLPLNRLEVHEPNLDGLGKDAKSLIADLEFDPQYEKAVKHIFGRTLVCRNKQVATGLAKNMRCDCVTLDGDQVQSKGTMTGGFYDTRRSKLSVHNTKLQAQETVADTETELTGIRAELDKHTKSTTSLSSECHRLGELLSNQEKNYEDMKTQYMTLATEQRGGTYAFSKDRQIQQIDSDLAVLEGKKGGLEGQLGTELMSQLDNEDQMELDGIQQELKRLKKDGDKIFAERSKLETEKNKIENHLKDNLMRKRADLESKLQSVNVDSQRANLESQKAMLSNVHARLVEINKALAELDAELSEYDEEKGPIEEKIKELEDKEQEVTVKLAEEQRLLEKIATKYTDYLAQKEQCVKKIRDLGTLPAEAFEKYTHLKSKQLYRKLDDCNKELKKYENVNKKALDQFVSFSEQKVTLVRRKEELDKGYQSIKDMIDVLDQRKYDAIMLTFQQVSKHFQDVFEKLVPVGHAELSMKTSDGVIHDSMEGDEVESGGRNLPPLVERFCGVGIKVSFAGRGETREMQQLSGGQKSLVALALIFAIQKCDPAPFYLFDEIDAALDAQHRKAVADMMREMCKQAQFITTTFRPELLESADKFYGVRFRNKVSHIDCVTKEEAYDFVEDDTTH